MGKSILWNDKIHVNESLTIYWKRLFGQINKFKQYRFLWTANGKILLRATESSIIEVFTTIQCQPSLLNPVKITSTKLRKYIPTISQPLSLEERDIDWVVKHLGHDLHVHRDFYMIHKSITEIAKMSKLPLVVDQSDQDHNHCIHI